MAAVSSRDYVQVGFGAGQQPASGGLGEQLRAGYAALHPDAGHVVEYVATSAADELPAAAAGLRRPGTTVSTVVVRGFPGEPERLVGLEGHLLGGQAEVGVSYLSSLLPADDDGALIAPGDLRGQTEAVFAAAQLELAARGLGTEAIVMTVDHTTAATRGDYPRTGRARRTYLGPVFPGAAGILQDRMVLPGALVSLDVVASRHPLRAVNPGWERYAKLTYSPAVEAGPLLFLAGQGALDPVTELAVHDGDLAAQTAFTYQGLRSVLATAGLGPDSLLHVVEYLTPAAADGGGVVDATRDQVLDGFRPATSRVLCAGLLRPEFLIEVIAVAARG